jgi:nanoRNase/pAp phosphatase (c-di-AMP/oligoRNAs hydrolase)
LGIKVHNHDLNSDLGKILSKLGYKNGLANLAMIYKDAGYLATTRVSFRSHRTVPKPLAQIIAESFGGGGHVCASGCQIDSKIFKKVFKISAFTMPEIKDLN